jgi:hypothetical protein
MKITDNTVFQISQELYRQVWGHLLFAESRTEEAAFVFAKSRRSGTSLVFQAEETYLVPSTGFAHQSGYYLELTDETRALVIKRAHDLGSCLVELHSHIGPYPPRFSSSDLAGFEEFVPHVRWRLKQKPYAAIVVGQKGFDGFAWEKDSSTPARLQAIEVVGKIKLRATALTPLRTDFQRRSKDEQHQI